MQTLLPELTALFNKPGIKPKILPIKIHIDIFPENKVALYTYHKDEQMGVVIEHEAFFTTMKTVFQLAWAGVELNTH